MKTYIPLVLYMRRTKDFLLDLIFPRRATCMGCGSMLGCDRNDICDDCRQVMARNWIGVRIPDKRLHLDGAAFAYAYRGPAGSVVRNLKYTGVQVLVEEMSGDLARAIAGLQLEHKMLVTAVPMHPKRQRRRGINHAELLARHTAQRLNLEYSELLMRTRNAVQQARLSREERKENMHGVFAVCPECREAVRGAEILLIDDVLTTGATAAACAKALRDAGAYRVYFAAYASAD